MTEPVVPHDLAAEEAVIGSMLLSPAAVRTVLDTGIAAADFYRPAHGHIFSAIEVMHGKGEGVDTLTVADRLRRANLIDTIGGVSTLASLLTSAPATSSASYYARIVREMAALRRAIGVASWIADDARKVPRDVVGFLAEARDRITALESSASDAEAPSYELVADFARDRPEVERDWLLEPFLERGERILMVASPGTGKSVIARQFAVAAACGVNPLLAEVEMKPIRTLVVDLENPDGVLHRSLSRLDRMARRGFAYDPERAAVWHQPSGINLRSQRGFDQFDMVLADHAPDLVCLGPLYKAFRKERGESDEDAALDVLAKLDDLRGRHRFALVLEHHAPHGQELRPFGSSVLQRWPEFGPALTIPAEAKPGDRSRLLWAEWRGPREIRPWPRLIIHGDHEQWPWLGVWDDGKRPALGPNQEGLEF